MGTLSLRLGCHFERHHVFFRIFTDLQGLRLRDIAREHSRNTEAFMMHAQHDVRRLGNGKRKKLHQNVNDEILRCVIIVVKDDHIARGLLQPRDRCQVPLPLGSLLGVGHGSARQD